MLHSTRNALSHTLLGACFLVSIAVAKPNSSLDKDDAAKTLDNDIVTINRMPEEDLKDRLKALSTLMGDGKLDNLTMQSLDKLRSKAQSVAEINHACGSVSINSIPDPRCSEFYLKELPAFEQEYSKVTGNVYMNRLTLTKGMKDRRSQINACVQGMEAFLNPDFAPQKFASLKVTKMDVDPVDEKTIDVSWTVQEVMDQERVSLLESRIEAWKSACGPVTHNADGEWNPYFLSQSKNHFFNSPYVPEGDRISYTEGWKHVVYLNEAALYSENNPAIESSHFYVGRNSGLNWRWNGSHQGKVRVAEGNLNAVASNVLMVKKGNPMTDGRDGKEYKTVVLGGKTWMAENLNYPVANSWCYDNDTLNCQKYGRLYDWNAAKKACPRGWHLPTEEEWTFAGKNGLSRNTFSVLPAGGRYYYGGSFEELGNVAIFWSASENDERFAWRQDFNYGNAYVYRTNSNKVFGYSLRCLQD